MAKETISLNPGEAAVVSFQTIPAFAKTYTVSINGLTGNFTCMEAPPLVFCHLRLVHELIDKSLVVTEAHGKIGNLSVSATKTGYAGVEATFHFATEAERITVEILGWYEYGKFVTGLTLYDYNKTPRMQRSKTVKISNPSEMLLYEVLSYPTAGIHTIIRRPNGTKIFDDIYACTLNKIASFQTELEYYRSAAAGSFNFNGVATLDWGYDASVGKIPLGPACTFYEDKFYPNKPCLEFLGYEHYQSNGAWVMEGKIKDPS